ncbi:MAG: hypothetical protein HYV96_05810 [Opitutae bacterium]|nr:hypothetical protein [Opitutae bacterium]
MAVSFESIQIGRNYTRPHLATIWGYSGYQALSRGLVTPANDNKILFFITRERRAGDTAYQNQFVDDVLRIDGPEDHFAEDRVLNSAKSGDEVHLFFRELHRDAFRYCGQMRLVDAQVYATKPSRFAFRRNSE